MRVLRAVVGAQSLLVRTREANFAKRRPLGSQLVGDDNRRNEPLVTKEFAEQAQCRDLVALGLNENFENLAFAVNGTPHVHLASGDRDHHFVEMPTSVRFGPILS